MSFAEAHDVRRGKLGILDHCLLARMWPRERVLMGLRVCKELRQTLLLHKEDVLLSARSLFDGYDRSESESAHPHAGQGLAQSVALFQHSGLQVHLRARSCKAVNGILQSLDEFALKSDRRCLVSLDLTKTYIRSAGTLPLAQSLRQGVSASLTHLNLSDNKITDGIHGLSDVLQHCSKLTHLDLSTNPLREEGCLSLAHILPQLSCLNTLNVRGTSLGMGSGALLLALGQCAALTDVDISFNEIGIQAGVPASSHTADPLSEGLRACSMLTRLDVGGNWISHAGACSLSSGLLGSATSLQTLQLGSNGFHADSMRQLCGVIAQCEELTTLDLSGNSLQTLGVRELCSTLPQCKALQALDLSCNALGGSEGATLLAQTLALCSRLQFLNLDGNNLRAAGAGAMAEGMRGAVALREVRFVSNSFMAEGARRLAEGLGGCSQLERLHLGENGLEVEGTRAVCAGLTGRREQLELLDLSEGGMGVQGTRELCALLQGCNSLTYLELSGNRIGDEGAARLSEALAGCGALRDLTLSYNALGRTGVSLLAAMLHVGHCSALERLDLGWNDMGDAGATAVAECLGKCRQLERLDVSYNRIQPAGCGALVRAGRGCAGLKRVRLSGNCAGPEVVGLSGEGAEQLEMAAMLPAPDKALPHGPDRDADRALSFRWPQDPAPSR